MSAVLPLFKVKRCSKCRRDLPTHSFSKAMRNPDGLAGYCKKCQADVNKKYLRTARGKHMQQKRDRKRLSTLRGRADQLIRNAQGRAQHSGREFNITIEWVLARLQIGRCEVTGIEFDFSYSGKVSNPYAPSIDRIDNNRGYTPENCRIICWALNAAFAHWGENVYATIATAYFKNK